MKFEWKGFDKMAKNMDGDIEAASLEDAAERLRKGGIFVQNIVPKPGSATPPPTPEIPAPVAAQPTPPPVPQPAAPAEPPVPQATEPSEPSAPVGESSEEPLAPWEKDLQDSLHFSKRAFVICGIDIHTEERIFERTEPLFAHLNLVGSELDGFCERRNTTPALLFRQRD